MYIPISTLSCVFLMLLLLCIFVIISRHIFITVNEKTIIEIHWLPSLRNEIEIKYPLKKVKTNHLHISLAIFVLLFSAIFTWTFCSIMFLFLPIFITSWFITVKWDATFLCRIINISVLKYQLQIITNYLHVFSCFVFLFLVIDSLSILSSSSSCFRFRDTDLISTLNTK